MNKTIPILFIFYFSAFPAQAQIPQSTATYGFEEDLKRIIDQWKPEANDVLELRFKPVNDNHTFPRKGSKRHSVLLQYVNDTILKQQDFHSHAEYLVKTDDGWFDYNFEKGQSVNVHRGIFIKDSAGYSIEKIQRYFGNENVYIIYLIKYDSLNREIESKRQKDGIVYVSITSYFDANKTQQSQYRIDGSDTTLTSEFYNVYAPWVGQSEKVDTMILMKIEDSAVFRDTAITIYRYQYNNSGKIKSIKRINRRNKNGRLNSEESDCYVIYRKRYPKRRVRDLQD